MAFRQYHSIVKCCIQLHTHARKLFAFLAECFHRIIQYPELEGTQEDHYV